MPSADFDWKELMSHLYANTRSKFKLFQEGDFDPNRKRDGNRTMLMEYLQHGKAVSTSMVEDIVTRGARVNDCDF